MVRETRAKRGPGDSNHGEIPGITTHSAVLAANGGTLPDFAPSKIQTLILHHHQILVKEAILRVGAGEDTRRTRQEVDVSQPRKDRIVGTTCPHHTQSVGGTSKGK